MTRAIIVSSDGHGGIPRDAYRSYIEQKYHADFDDYDNTLSAWESGQSTPFPVEVCRDRDEIADRTQFMDSQNRLRELEKMGVVGEVIFPGASPATNPPWSDFLSADTFRTRTPRTRELQWAGERAYNRWLSEFCLDAPGRRVGLALLPLHDMEATVKEIYWAKENGLGGVVFPNFNYDLPEYVHGWYWDPMFRACEEVGFPLNLHGGNGGISIGEHKALTALEFEFFAKRPFWHLIFGGAFDRFPNLKVATTESTASWIPEMFVGLDAIYSEFKRANEHRTILIDDQHLPERLPSEYWNTNGFVGVSLVRLDEMEARDRIGVGTMMYGVDYPHPEGTWGQAMTWMQAAIGRAGVSEQEARMMLGLNAARCYGLDLDVLAPVAERVGPAIEEVLVKPADAEVADLLKGANEDGFILAARHYESGSILPGESTIDFVSQAPGEAPRKKTQSDH
jgi:predicted TIM-barrel fold metal-dependent hydrolase